MKLFNYFSWKDRQCWSTHLDLYIDIDREHSEIKEKVYQGKTEGMKTVLSPLTEIDGTEPLIVADLD